MHFGPGAHNTPDPERRATDHTVPLTGKGSAESAAAAHAPGHAHAMGGADPPAQKEPAGQGAPPAPPAQPAGQPKPGAAVQGPLHAAVACPAPEEYSPAAHTRGAEFTGQ